jgi:CHAT domain-containing protein/Flp pilus assembly protein TadD
MENQTGLKGFLLVVEDMVHRGELQDAYRLLKNFVSKLPPNPPLLQTGPYELEGCFWDNEEFFKFVEDNRESLQESLIWNDMPPAKAFYWLAWIAYEWHDFQAALRHIDEGIARDPTRPQMYCEKGVILNGCLRFEEALAAYRQAVTARPWVSDKEKARALRGQGYALIELRRLEEGREVFEKSLKFDPDNKIALGELRHIEELLEFIRKYDPSAEPGALVADPRAAAAHFFAEAERLADSVPDAQWQHHVGPEPRALGPDEPLGRALALYEEARRLWRSAGDLAGQAQAFHGMGRLHLKLSDIVKFMECFEEALHLWHQAGGHEAEEALVSYKLGWLMLQVGRSDDKLNDRALSYLQDALRLNRNAGDLVGQVAALQVLAQAHEESGAFHKAIGFYEQLHALAGGAGDSALESEALLHIAKNYERLGEFDFALSFYRRLLQQPEIECDKNLEAIVHYNVGLIHHTLFNFEEARRHIERAQSLAEAAGNGQIFGMSVNALAVTYYAAGDKPKALDLYNQSLALRRRVKDGRGEVATLRNMSMIYVEMGDWDKAQDCFKKCLEISRAEKDREGEAHTLSFIGEVLYRGGEYRRALSALEHALEIHLNELKGLSGAGVSHTLTHLAYVRRALGDLAGARVDIEAAIKRAEKMRAKVFNPDWRASVLAASGNAYEFYVGLLANSGETAAAFEASEQGRARSLLDLLSEAGADIRQAVDPSLLDHERELQKAIVAAEGQLPKAVGGGASEELSELETSLAGWRAELQLVQSQIRASSPHSAALTRPRQPRLSEIQSLLDAETLLLEYALGNDASHLWVVSRDSLRHYRLPARAKIEKEVYRFRSLLTARNVEPAPDEKKSDAFKRRNLASANADGELPAAALSLSLAVFNEAGAVFSAAKRLLIVADGALHYVPFAVLTNPAAAESGARPLVMDYEIVYLPSASTLAVLRAMSQHRRQRAPRSVAIFADPVFEMSDPRAASNRPPRVLEGAGVGRSPESLTAELLSRSAEESGFAGGKFKRLEGSRDEAETIFSLIGQEGGMMAVGFEASRETLRRTDLTEYRVIHFATHGVLNSKHPELSGVVLSMYNERGEPQNGYLRLRDIYDMRLSADLVVLSACQTALGKEIRGEGLVGLTRGFMYAGTPRVLATLWEVHDLATAELMKLFYEGVRRNTPPAAALREAQLKLMEHTVWKSPYYWAAFVLQGEW